MPFTLPWGINYYVSTHINNGNAITGTSGNVSLKVNGNTELAATLIVGDLALTKFPTCTDAATPTSTNLITKSYADANYTGSNILTSVNTWTDVNTFQKPIVLSNKITGQTAQIYSITTSPLVVNLAWGSAENVIIIPAATGSGTQAIVNLPSIATANIGTSFLIMTGGLQYAGSDSVLIQNSNVSFNLLYDNQQWNALWLDMGTGYFPTSPYGYRFTAVNTSQLWIAAPFDFKKTAITYSGNVWQGTNSFNSHLPTSTIATTTSGTQFMTRNLNDTRYGQLASTNTWSLVNTFSSAPVMSGASITSNTIPYASLASDPRLIKTGNSYNYYTSNSLSIITTGDQNTVYGSAGAWITDGGSNALFGLAAGNRCGTTSSDNTAIGIGAMGYSAAAQSICSFNTAVGRNSLGAITTGTANVSSGWNSANALTTGSNNTFIGSESGINVTTGNLNTGIGYQCNYSSPAYDGSNNTFLGANTDLGASVSNVTCVGANTVCSTASTIQLGSNSETVAISGSFKSGANNITATQLGYLAGVLTGIVDLSSNQTIGGAKIFSTLPTSSDTTTTPVDNSLIRKAYADTVYGRIGSTNTWAATQTFSVPPVLTNKVTPQTANVFTSNATILINWGDPENIIIVPTATGSPTTRGISLPNISTANIGTSFNILQGGTGLSTSNSFSICNYLVNSALFYNGSFTNFVYIDMGRGVYPSYIYGYRFTAKDTNNVWLVQPILTSPLTNANTWTSAQTFSVLPTSTDTTTTPVDNSLIRKAYADATYGRLGTINTWSLVNTFNSPPVMSGASIQAATIKTGLIGTANESAIKDLYIEPTRANCALGNDSLISITTGVGNCALSTRALKFCTTGDNNMGIGTQALSSLTSGIQNVGISTGALQSYNGSSSVGIGAYSGYSLTSGNENVMIGYYAGVTATSASSTVCIGNNAGAGSATLNSCVFIGNATTTAGTKSNVIVIGAGNATASNDCIIGDSNNNVKIAGTLAVTGTINSISSTVFGYISGLTSSAQTQINNILNGTSAITLLNYNSVYRPYTVASIAAGATSISSPFAGTYLWSASASASTNTTITLPTITTAMIGITIRFRRIANATSTNALLVLPNSTGTNLIYPLGSVSTQTTSTTIIFAFNTSTFGQNGYSGTLVCVNSTTWAIM